MELNWDTFLITFLLGNGALFTLFTFIFKWIQSKSQRDFEARKEGRKYYMGLYGHIAILHELVGAYYRSTDDGNAKLFNFKKHIVNELTSQQILGEFNKAYEEFLKFYIETKCKGQEIFISEKLKKILGKFWIQAKEFYENNAYIDDEKKILNFNNLAEETTKIMEKLFGLK